MSTYKFIQLSDIHLMDDYRKQSVSKLYNITGMTPRDTFNQTVNLIKNEFSEIDFKFVLVTGDLTSDSSEKQYRHIKDTLEQTFQKPIVVCPGNHDSIVPFRNIFSSDNGEGEYFGIYSFEELDIVILDTMHDKSGIGRVCDRQIKWLESLENKDRRIIIAMHHPPYFSNDNNELKYHVENAEQLYQVLRDKNVLAVLCGHIHRAIAYKFGDIPVYTAGSTAFGARFTREYMEYTNELGFNICTISEQGISVENISVPVTEEHKVQMQYEV